MNKKYSIVLMLLLACHIGFLCAKIMLKFNDNTELEVSEKQFDDLKKYASIFNNYYWGQDATLNVNHDHQLFSDLLEILEQEGTKKTQKALKKLDANKLNNLAKLAEDFKMQSLIDLINPLPKKPEKKPRPEKEEEQPKSPKKPKIEEPQAPVFYTIPVPENDNEKNVLLNISRNSITIKNLYELSGITDITLNDLQPIEVPSLTEDDYKLLFDFAQNVDLSIPSQILQRLSNLQPAEKVKLMIIADYLEIQKLLNAAITLVSTELISDNFLNDLYANEKNWKAFLYFSAKFPTNLINIIAQKKMFRKINGPNLRTMIQSAIINPEGSIIYSAASFNTINAWRNFLNKNSEVTSININDQISTMALTHDGSEFIVSSPGRLFFYNNQFQQIHIIIFQLQFLAGNMAVSADNNYLYAIFSKIFVQIKLTDYSLTTLVDNLKTNDYFTSLVCDPTNVNQIAIGINNTVNLYLLDHNLKKLKLIKSFTPDPQANPKDISHQIKSIAFSKDGAHLIIASGNKITIWDIASGAKKHELNGHTNLIFSISVSHDNAFIASGSQDRSIIIWDFHDGKKLTTIPTSSTPLSIYFNPKEYGLAAGEIDGQVSYYPLDGFLLKFSNNLSLPELMLYLIIKHHGIARNATLPAHLQATFNEFTEEMKKVIWE